MMQRKSLPLLGAIILAMIARSTLSAEADTSGNPDGPGLETALVDSSAEVYGSVPGSAGARSKAITNSPASRRAVRMVRTYVPACEGNWPDSPDSLGTLCPRAIQMCAGTPDSTDLGFWVFTAPAGGGPRTQDSWTATGEFACRGAADDDEPAAVEPVVTAEDFRRLPLPAAEINVQPPNRRTLISIPTNLYADAAPVVLPTTILGQPVRVRATPMRFRWTYGDGTALTTADPGAPYPDLRTAHTYRRPGTPTLGLTTTYSGEYSVAGGAWLPIDGLATVNSPSTRLTVLAARNELVAEPLS
jgi:hypothetical protein